MVMTQKDYGDSGHGSETEYSAAIDDFAPAYRLTDSAYPTHLTTYTILMRMTKTYLTSTTGSGDSRDI